MRCPADGANLQRVRMRAGGFVWACGRCNGRAIALPVLRRNFAAGVDRAVWKEAFHGPPNGVDCPSCGRAMTVARVQFDDEPVALDVCRACALVWFDPAEHLQLPPAPEPPSDGLTPEARQQLAILEVQATMRRWQESDAEQPSLHPSRLPALLRLPVEVRGHELACKPWATWITATVVAGVSVAGFVWPGVVHALQMVPADVFGSGLPTLATAFFVHAGWLHLAGNLWFLVTFGDNVEDLLGYRRWLLLVLLATLLGALLHVAFDPRATTPCVGASGGISGLVVFYALAMPQARLGVFVFAGMYARWVTFSALGGLCVWLALQAFTVLKQVYGAGSVSGLAHVGGAAVGFLFWLLWRRGLRG
ncbi:MAG: rhomboid family intramembrane serine protease [Planctomycetes bacterium]|nr:rhomboid family intramembrane serine protease [Planctomycetota bacterium]